MNEIKPELILYDHNFLKEQINESLILVKEYIIKNNLIIVGGMAIDLSLRTIGLNIYDDHDIPDYDVYSYDNLLHSQELVKLLCVKNLPNVSMMPAIHNTTIRVKMSGYTVFDCTYVPKNIYNRIPTINSLGFNVIDPNYQKIDQYNSLSFLFDITGVSYNIFHRLQKDIDRNKLLVDNFDIKGKFNFITNIDKLVKLSISNKLFNGDLFEIYDSEGLVKNINNINDYVYAENTYIETDHNFCLHGIAAYSFYYELIKKASKSAECEELFKQSNVAKINVTDSKFEFYAPDNTNIVLVNNNNNYIELLKDYKIKTKYNSLLDIFPIRIEYENNIEIFDLFGRMVSIKIGQFNEDNFIITNFTYLLSYFLAKYYFDDSGLNNVYLSYYYSMLNLVKINEMLESPLYIFNYTLSTFGKHNYSEPYFYFIKNMKHLYETNKNSTEKPKASYLTYPDCNSNIEFDYMQSEFFLIDGNENNDMKYTNLAYLLE